jgi:hypothetical protein
VDVGVTTSLPLGFLEPLQSPTAVHVEAFVDDQLSVELPPMIIEGVLAVIVTVGAGVGAGEFPPPQPASAAARIKALMVLLNNMNNSTLNMRFTATALSARPSCLGVLLVSDWNSGNEELVLRRWSMSYATAKYTAHHDNHLGGLPLRD